MGGLTIMYDSASDISITDLLDRAGGAPFKTGEAIKFWVGF